MKSSSLFVALCILPAFLVVVNSARGFSNDYKTVPARISHGAHQYRSFTPSPTRRKPWSSITKEIDTALAAVMNGTIYLLDVESSKPLWSFESGSALYASYQARVDNVTGSGLESEYYIDCGDDWDLYAHSKLGKVKLRKTIKEYVSSTPWIVEEGGIVLGSIQTKAFMVDGKTGSLIKTYQMPSPSSYATQYGYQDDDAFDNDALFFTRTDYTLTSLALKSDKVLWNLTVAEIGVASICQDTEDSLDEAVLGSGSSGGAGFNMPLPCQSQGIVYRYQDEGILETLFRSSHLTEANHPGMVISATVHDDSLSSQPNVGKPLQMIPSSLVVTVLDSSGSDSTKSLPSVTEDTEIISRENELNAWYR